MASEVIQKKGGQFTNSEDSKSHGICILHSWMDMRNHSAISKPSLTQMTETAPSAGDRNPVANDLD